MQIKGSSGGGWDEKAHEIYTDQLGHFNAGLANAICKSINPQSALDFGGGTGEMAYTLKEKCGTSPTVFIEPVIKSRFSDRVTQIKANIFEDELPEILTKKKSWGKHIYYCIYIKMGNSEL